MLRALFRSEKTFRCESRKPTRIRRILVLQYGGPLRLSSGPVQPKRRKPPADWRTAILRIHQAHGGLAGAAIVRVVEP